MCGISGLTTKHFGEVDLQATIESIRNGSPTPVPPEEGREAVRVMDLLVGQLAAGIT